MCGGVEIFLVFFWRIVFFPLQLPKRFSWTGRQFWESDFLRSCWQRANNLSGHTWWWRNSDHSLRMRGRDFRKRNTKKICSEWMENGRSYLQTVQVQGYIAVNRWEFLVSWKPERTTWLHEKLIAHLLKTQKTDLFDGKKINAILYWWLFKLGLTDSADKYFNWYSKLSIQILNCSKMSFSKWSRKNWQKRKGNYFRVKSSKTSEQM